MLPFYGRKVSRRKNDVDFEKLKNFDFFLHDSEIQNIDKKINFFSSPPNLEIGFGHGDNIIYQSRKNVREIFLACDPFISGSVKLKKKIESLNIKNIFFTNCDFSMFNKFLKKIIFNKVYILFPDPWPKRRHNKRRLINKLFVKKLKKITSNNSKIFIATDDDDYAAQINHSFKCEESFHLSKSGKDNSIFNNLDLYPTKYFLKAMEEKRKINYFIFKK